MVTGWVSNPKFGGIKSSREKGRPTPHPKGRSYKGKTMCKGKFLIIAALLALSACGTVDGIGRDISGGANRVAGWMGG